MFLFSYAYAYAYVACVMLIAQVWTRLKTISQSTSTNAYVNDVLTEHKHKHKHKKKAYAYAYVAAVLTSAQASYA